ncbi:MAG TPA: ATP-dependent sacrificial sulfur transferase LarE [Thermoplasmata archaeon]|nr:ATP-dependent sacrificial sulfur transferase LarE [Thermoplasmata archaeon]
MALGPSFASPPAPESEIVRRIAAGGPAVVALSGGVDSGLVAALAQEALGPLAAAVTLTGTAVSVEEVEAAHALARAIGIDHHVVRAEPLENGAYRANGPERCYHCRSVETAAVRRWAAGRGFSQYLDGVHADDLGDDRPGLRAMDEAGFVHPLVLAGWGKAAVRAAARRRGLPNWNRPSNACLASRVAHGEPITPELLRRIESAEAVLTAEGFRRVRVRVDAGGARLEVDPDEVARLSAEPTASRVVGRVRTIGFDPVTIDPRGYATLRGALPVVR